MHLRTSLFALAGIIGSSLISLPFFAFADTPVISGLSANPSYISNNLTTTLTWQNSGTHGQQIYINCPSGVTVKDASTGSTFPCGLITAIGTAADFSAGFTITNVSGGTRTVSATIYPLTTSDERYDAGAATTYVSVGTSAQPVTDVTVPTSPVSSGKAFTVSWTGVDATGMNLQLSCEQGLLVYTSLDSAPLPCGTPAFTTNLALSGSLTLYAVNSTQHDISLRTLIMPALTSSTYDASRGKSQLVTIQAPAVLNPAITAFSASKSLLSYQDSVSLSWTAQDSTGVNLKFACTNGITISFVDSTGTTTLPCSVPAFAIALATTGSTTVSIMGANTYGANVTVTALPQDAAGSYYQISGKSLNLYVSPAGVMVQDQPINTFAQNAIVPVLNSIVPGLSSNAAPIAQAISQAVQKAVAAQLSLNRSLYKGLNNPDVKALQEFLAQDSSIYPEAITTGFYGSLTERAVQRFQMKHSIAAPGDAGYGFVGPKTRAVLNSLQTP